MILCWKMVKNKNYYSITFVSGHSFKNHACTYTKKYVNKLIRYPLLLETVENKNYYSIILI